jgi:hypothetical protein
VTATFEGCSIQKAGQTFERFLQQFYNELIAATCVETIDAVMACNSPASA